MNHYRSFFKIYDRAARKMCKDCRPFIEKGSKILDIGCGSGIVAKNLKDSFDVKVFGVDVEDKRVADIPFKISDGEELPFSDNEFDISFISFVLHHAQKPDKLLKEARRVSKNKIIIYEDLAEGFISNFFCQIHGFLFDKFCQAGDNPASFKSEKEWEDIFNSLGMPVILKKRLKSLYPVKQILFVLTKRVYPEFIEGGT